MGEFGFEAFEGNPKFWVGGQFFNGGVKMDLNGGSKKAPKSLSGFPGFGPFW